MRGKRVLLVGALAVAVAPALRAQVRGSLSVIPTAGYVLSAGGWIDETTLDFGGGDRANYALKPKGGVFVGLIAEYNLSKNLSLAAHASRTLGITQRLSEVWTATSGFFTPDQTFEADMATTNIGGMLVFRPLGRLPSGAPKTVYFEAGGALNIYSVTSGFTDVNNQAAIDSVSYKYTTPAIMGGAGLSFPVGPRASLQLFGRAYYQLKAYESNALTNFNQSIDSINSQFGTNVANLDGKKSILLQFGLGLRVGR